MPTSDRPAHDIPNLAAKRAQLLASITQGSRTIRAIPRRRDKGPAVLSPGQARLFFLDQLYPENPAYNLPLAFDMKGGLNTDALQKAFDEIVLRHDILRTTVSVPIDVPRQFVNESARFKIQILPMTSGDTAFVRRFIAGEAERPFDLGQLPLFRVQLLRLSIDHHVFVLIAHHIIWDAWSSGLFLAELAEGYRAACEGRSPAYSELLIQYADYADWQTQWVESSECEEQLAYWKKQLGSAPTNLTLPFDREAPGTFSFKGADLPLTVEGRTASAIMRLCKEERTTSFVVLAAAIGAWLYRYGRSDEILLGCPVANRGRRELERLIGLFVNTLVLKIDLSGNPTFRTLVGRVRQVTREALSHQGVPFERVVQAMGLGRERDRNPLFQAMFLFGGSGVVTETELHLPGLTVTELDLLQTTAKLDLYLRIDQRGRNYAGHLEYSVDRFSATAGSRMATHFEQILADLAGGPDRPISTASMLNSEESAAIAGGRNRTFKDYGVQRGLHDLTHAQALRTPAAPACIYEGSVLSYNALDSAASSVARKLHALGAGPDIIVGVAARRSLELMIGVLAVLKSGAAYLPLDPDLPLERLQFMARDCKVQAIVVQRELADRFSKMGANLVMLHDATVGEPGDSFTVPIELKNLAYVIYTSGSTGVPKACMNTHEGICNRLLWMQQAYQLGPYDKVLQKTPLTFDVSVWELFWPLISGATVVVAHPQAHRDPSHLAEAIARNGITTVHFVPSMLDAFLDVADGQQCKKLKRVISSGEALSAGLSRRFFAAFPEVELHNLYGPTETAIDVTAYKCQRDSDGQAIPIGNPIANVQAYVLDREMMPVPAGVPGELCIGGVAVGRGYWNRPDLTAERYIPDPFSQAPGQRLYRTGDLVRWPPEGALEFLDRIDRQVKINGNRVELGEIESALRKDENVLDTVVIPIKEGGKPSDLAAYVIPRGTTEPGQLRSVLRSRLRTMLPDYMVPAHFVFLSAFPLTSSGKVDRSALPAPVQDERFSAIPYVAPQTPTQTVLAELWAQQLGIDVVGIRDNFFELGGDSIRSLKLVAVAERMGLHITVQQMFSFQTIEELSAQLEKRREVRLIETPPAPGMSHPAAAERSPAYRYDPAEFPLAGLDAATLNQQLAPYQDVEDVFPLINLQDDLFAQHLAGSDPALGMVQKVTRMAGAVDVQGFDSGFQMLAQRHQVARTSFLWKGLSRPLQVIHKSTRLPVGYLDWRHLSPSQQEMQLNKYLAEDAERGLELHIPTPIRTVFIQIADDVHWMVMSFNYMCLEGWSLSLLQSEQRAIMTALHNGEQFAVVQEPSYREYVSWLLNQNFEEAEQFWTKHLQGCILPTPLVGRLGPGVKESKRFEREDSLLSGNLTTALRSLAWSRRRTENSIYQGAWALVISDYADLDDVVLGIAVTGRSCEFPRIQSLVGYAMNYLPLHLKIDREQSFLFWLEHVQNRQTAALQFEHTPPKKIRAWCGLAEEQLAFESIFYFQNADAPTFGEIVGRFYARTGYPLRIDVIPQTADIGTQIFASYHERFFGSGAIRQLLSTYIGVLEAIAKDPTQSLDSLMKAGRAARA
jgi:amino acid adenylation domain-containing protein